MDLVFISHSNQPADAEVCERLYRYLSGRGICCWMDREDMHHGDWKQQIINRLLEATAFILVESVNSLRSPEVQKEIDLMVKRGEENGCPLIPFALDEYCLTMDKKMGSALYNLGSGSLQTVFLNKYPTEEEAFSKLCSYLPPELAHLKNDPSDFEFDAAGAVLKKYKGNDPFVEIPEFVHEITEGAFVNNRELVTVRIADSVEKIGRRAFFGCTMLSRVDGMNNVIDADVTAFRASGLCPEEGKPFLLNGILFGGDFPDGVFPQARSIATNAFYGYEAKEIVFADGLQTIGEGAFMDSYMQKVSFPSTLKQIGRKAFASCRQLKEVVFCGQAPENAHEIFKQAKITEEK